MGSKPSGVCGLRLVGFGFRAKCKESRGHREKVKLQAGALGPPVVCVLGLEFV